MTLVSIFLSNLTLNHTTTTLFYTLPFVTLFFSLSLCFTTLVSKLLSKYSCLQYISLFICDISIFLSNYQFDAPEDNPSLRQYCIQVPGGASPNVHNCHFTNTSFCGACVYIHGSGARPRVTHCTIANANNVGVFVDDHAHVSLLLS